ncbi:phage tail tape measure protein [Aurantimonas endophytica]|uniref:Phage-related minor tail protein n=1 Tax=Aurantimonas endophytica TaxID=1522175 RepID=A0A7W6HFT0_9HYPH|nr:phage-related minor tail protein [Aurantimonas endophytica]MCO6405053.1 phage tail tape measure protein [Aurantimonas endophytica]
MEDDETLSVAIVADTSGFATAMDDLTRRANSFGTAISAALRGAVSGGRSFDTVLRQLGQRISAIALDAALRPLTNLAANGIGQVLGGIGGAVAGQAQNVLPFAKGGVVGTPTFFPTGGRLGLMGEAGAEAILPLRRGADGTLGVVAPSGGAAGPSIVFNVTSPDAESFRRSEAQIQAMLARAAGRGRRGL